MMYLWFVRPKETGPEQDAVSDDERILVDNEEGGTWPRFLVART